MEVTIFSWRRPPVRFPHGVARVHRTPRPQDLVSAPRRARPGADRAGRIRPAADRLGRRGRRRRRAGRRARRMAHEHLARRLTPTCTAPRRGPDPGSQGRRRGRRRPRRRRPPPGRRRHVGRPRGERGRRLHERLLDRRRRLRSGLRGSRRVALKRLALSGQAS